MTIGLGVVGVAVVLPSSDFLDEGLFVGNPAIEALGRQDAEFGFRQIEPTAVLWGIVPFEALDLELYAAHVRRDGGSESDQNAMAALTGHLDGERVSEGARLLVALDPGMPVPMRLEAFALGPAPVDVRALPLVEAALAMPGYHPRSAAMKVIVKLADPIEYLRSALVRPDLSAKEKVELVGYFPRSLPSARKAEFFRALSGDTAIDEDLRWRLSAFAARYGDADAMSALVEAADRLPIEVVRAAIAIFGHHRSRSLAETAAVRLSMRALPPGDRAALSSSILLGMTALFQMYMFEGGAIDQAPLHPGAEAFRPLLERWAAMADYDPEDALRVAENLAQFGSKPALALTETRLRAVLGSDETDLRDSVKAGLVGSALTTLRERQHLLPLPFLETVIARCSYNGAARAVEMIAAYGSREALDILIALYGESSYSAFRSSILDALETVAGRLGVRVRWVGPSLEAAMLA